MTIPDSSSDSEFELSPPSRNEIALAMSAYLSQRSTDGEGHLRHAAHRVAREASLRGATIDQMVLAAKRLFERAPRISGDVQKRVEMLDKFVRYCTNAYRAGHDDSP